MSSQYKSAVTGAVVTMVAFITSVVAMWIGLLFLPILNGTVTKADGENISGRSASNTWLQVQPSARQLLETVYPILMILIPLFVLIAGITVTVVIVKRSR